MYMTSCVCVARVRVEFVLTFLEFLLGVFELLFFFLLLLRLLLGFFLLLGLGGFLCPISHPPQPTVMYAWSTRRSQQ